MEGKRKIYRLGQLITIENHVYRIVNGFCSRCCDVGLQPYKNPCKTCLAMIVSHDYPDYMLKLVK